MSIVVAHSVRGTDAYLILMYSIPGPISECSNVSATPQLGAAAVTEKIPITIKMKSERFFFMCFNISKIL